VRVQRCVETAPGPCASRRAGRARPATRRSSRSVASASTWIHLPLERRRGSCGEGLDVASRPSGISSGPRDRAAADLCGDAQHVLAAPVIGPTRRGGASCRARRLSRWAWA
jgi:hypothetical protein